MVATRGALGHFRVLLQCHRPAPSLPISGVRRTRLGFKRGLGEDLVIAPYASALALTVLPREACRNLQVLADSGFLGVYGFYEAVDYTLSRVPRGKPHVIVRSFMAHHQGMSCWPLRMYC